MLNFGVQKSIKYNKISNNMIELNLPDRHREEEQIEELENIEFRSQSDDNRRPMKIFTDFDMILRGCCTCLSCCFGIYRRKTYESSLAYYKELINLHIMFENEFRNVISSVNPETKNKILIDAIQDTFLRITSDIMFINKKAKRILAYLFRNKENCNKHTINKYLATGELDRSKINSVQIVDFYISYRNFFTTAIENKKILREFIKSSFSKNFYLNKLKEVDTLNITNLITSNGRDEVKGLSLQIIEKNLIVLEKFTQEYKIYQQKQLEKEKKQSKNTERNNKTSANKQPKSKSYS